MTRPFDPGLVAASLPSLAERLPTTLLIVTLSAGLASILGAALCYCRVYRIPVLGGLARLQVSITRGVPLLVQLFLAYFAVPQVLGFVGVDARHWDPLVFVVLALGFHEASFFSEIFRAGLLGVDPGQSDAAHSVGMTRWQAVSRILAPQAWTIVFPGWTNAILSLIRDTSLAFTIGAIDVMGMARATASRTAHPIESYLAATILFVGTGVAAGWLLSVLPARGASVGRRAALEGEHAVRY